MIVTKKEFQAKSTKSKLTKIRAWIFAEQLWWSVAPINNGKKENNLIGKINDNVFHCQKHLKDKPESWANNIFPA